MNAVDNSYINTIWITILIMHTESIPVFVRIGAALTGLMACCQCGAVVIEYFRKKSHRA